MAAARYVLSLSVAMLATALPAVADDNQDFFEKKIRPILVEHCYACHSSQGQSIEGGLRLDSRESTRRGGESGAAVVPKDLDKSLLLEAIRYDSFEMPPDRKLPDRVIADFEQWIANGAHDPRLESAEEHEPLASTIDFSTAGQHWSFQQPEEGRVDLGSLSPEFKDWPKNRIDPFVAARLNVHALKPSPPADMRLLARRVSFDLTGLPPPTDILAEAPEKWSEAQYLQYVDGLLMSDSYGEHFARLWLDLMRFAEDQAHIVGDNRSLFFPNASLYRDWVIAALNHDLPYDRFVQLQLAADLLTPEDQSDDVALGFVGLGPKYYRRSSPEVKAEEWEDRVDVLSRGLLGLTVACARCHDHKYDPIGTEDYYALAGVFASVEMYNRPLTDDVEVDEKKGQAKDPKDAMHVIRELEPQDLAVMIRGDVNRRGPTVPRGFLQVLAESPSEGRTEFSSGSGRLELAREITSPRNPLTARVIVNRIWGRLVGRPLVSTQSNFGALGATPSHPELLDDLAVRFMRNGWSLKWLCREIVTSATYRQSSLSTPPVDDPENVWLSQMHRKRLAVEQWRDALLVAAGRLNAAGKDHGFDPSAPESNRRTVYSEVSRLKLNPMLALFDFPDPNVHSSGRAQTTTPSQKLFLMNSPFMVEHADAIGELAGRQTHDLSEAVTLLYQRLFFRDPADQELQLALDYLGEQQQLNEFVHALLVSNEMMFID